jgi:hypothetical protein
LWEAADTGLLLWRRNLGYFIPFFAVPFWICAFAFLFLANSIDLLSSSSGNFPLLCAWFLLWWLNPLFDRFILHVVARRYFEPGLSFRALFRGLWGSLFRGLAGDLLWRRASPWRAAVMPLRVLERGAGGRKIAGGKRRRIAGRKRALAQGGLHFCVFLSVWCSLLLWVLMLGEIVFILVIAQLFFNSAWNFNDFFGKPGLYIYTLWCANCLLVESLYVCMGFGLYLNSRVEVEGWDIELLFRKFAARYRRPAALVVLLLGLGLPRLAGVFGQSADQPPGSLPPGVGAAMPAEALEEILNRDLGGERKTWGIRFKEDEERPEKAASPALSLPWGKFFRNIGAVSLRTVLILAFAALALACGIFVYRGRGRLRLIRPPGPPPPPVPRNAPPPESLLAEAGRLYGQGSVREAWGLCYAAALGALARYRLLRFPPGATEYRCLALVRRHQSGLERPFADLIRHWTALAYGGIEPPGGAFDEALAWAQSLCARPPEPPPAGRKPGAVYG